MSKLKVGTLIAGRYRVERLLSKGGQASVYVARDTKFDERVALKVAEAANDAALERLTERFGREARIGSRLGRTEGFVRARDWGQVAEDDRRAGGAAPSRSLYLALDFVESAGALDLESGTREERLVRLRNAARIVAEAHRQGIVHRDIKPENFLQGPDGSIRLTDFGLAKVVGEPLSDAPRPRDRSRRAAGAAAPSLTRTGDWHGTPLFMAPEQFSDMKRADVRVDVYALGVMLFYALTGKYPYDRSVMKEQRRVREGRAQPPRASELDPTVPPVLDLLCTRALALERRERLPGVDAFVDGLEAALAAMDGGARRPRPRFEAEAQIPEISGRLARQALIRPRASSTDSPSQAATPPRGTHVRPTSGATAEDRDARLPGTSTLPPSGPGIVEGDAPRRLPRGLRRGDAPGEVVVRRDGSVLVWVPAGVFRMGSDAADAWDNERPPHRVRLTRGVWLGKTPVTWAQYRRFCQKTRRPAPEPRSPAGPDHPVHGVSWDDAQAYCAWAGLRLPTEAEWERAARGTDGRAYPWGDGPPDPKSCCFLGADSTAPAGSLPAGAAPWGHLDLSGNVWEWVADLFGPYGAEPVVDPTGPTAGKYRLVRGGSWQSAPESCRTTTRRGTAPRAIDPTVGFRVARGVD